MTHPLARAAFAAFGTLLAAPALAQDPGLPESSSVTEPNRQFVIDLGVGLSYGPRYDGAKDYLAQPVPILGIGRFTIPNLIEFGDDDPTRGFFFYPTFDYIGSRDQSDDASLRGTDDVDWALALGAGGGYRYDWFRAFVQADYGFNGYSGWRGQIGADYVGEPGPRWTMSLGPRVSWAGGDYMETYFSVPVGAPVAPDGYEAEGGLRSVALAGNAAYAMTDSVFLLFNVRYDRLVGDAADSPIVEEGDENQVAVGMGVSYRFSFDLFR
jgi:outer membrane scaffolding protein for murein synthesis (MipA/OmpV family)